MTTPPGTIGAQPTPSPHTSSSSPLRGRKQRDLAIALAFRLYKSLVSPVVHAIAPGRCLYLPTCSEYAYIALDRFGLIRGSWLALDLTAGGGFDVITVAPHSTDLPSSNLDDQTTRIDAILSTMLTAHAAVAPGVVFLLSAGIDADLDSRQYVLAQGPTNTEVLEPWQVRPMILAGFGFTALGDGFIPSGVAR